MAYGMSSAELAKVGQNVNNQGQGVDEQSIQAAMDRELTEDRKKQVGKFKSRKDAARSKDAQQKAELRSNLVKAVVSSAVKGLEFGAERAAENAGPKSLQIEGRADRAEAKGNLKRAGNLRDRAANVRSKEEIRAARRAENVKKRVANQQAAAAKKAASKPQQEAAAVRDFENRFGANRGPRYPGTLKLKRAEPVQGSIFDQAGGAGKTKTTFGDLT